MNWRKNVLKIKIIIIIIVGALGFLLIKYLTAIGKAFGEKCKIVDNYHVKNYKIEKLECLGWAGPKYHPYDLYENDVHLSSYFLKQDSCQFYFGQGEDKLVLLNTCNQTVQVLLAEKKSLIATDIDSVLVTKAETLVHKKLNSNEIAEFAIKWNNSNPDGAQDPDEKSYPDPKYYIEVFTKREVRIFNASHITIQEKGSFWEFNILAQEEVRTLQKFDQIFNMK